MSLASFAAPRAPTGAAMAVTEPGLAGDGRYPRRASSGREAMRPNPDLVRQAAHALAAAPNRDAILAKWGLTFDEIKHLDLGLHNGAISIPFRGIEEDLQGVKLRFVGKGHEDAGRFKWLNPGRAPGIFLIPGAIDGPVVVLLEGPLKAIGVSLLIRRPCAALPSGAAVGIPKEARELFRGKYVLYIADGDEEGLRVPGLLERQLRGIALSVRAIAFPPKEWVVPGRIEDINDLLREWRQTEPDSGIEKIEQAGNWILDALAEAPDLLARTNGKAGASRQAAPTEEAGAGPIINAGDLDLARVAGEAWKALLAANQPPVIFRYGSLPAWLEKGDDGSPLIRLLSVDRLRHLLARVARWRTFRPAAGEGDGDLHPDDGDVPADAKTGKKEYVTRPALPPLHVARDMLAKPNLPLPILTRIVEAPVFAADGSLHLRPGYSPAGGLYYAPAPAGFAVPPVPERPTREDLARARSLIVDELLGDFPFVSEAELAHGVALLLLPFARELIDGPIPLHLIEKPSPGTGASLLADVLTFIATGRRVAAMTEGHDEDEWRKRITAKLLGGPAVIVIDNLRRRLEAAALSSAITASTWEDRLLGHTEMVRVPVRCAWVATGNNPVLSDEIARRTIRVRLDAKADRPWLREGFRHSDLRGWATAHRGQLVWAALTIIQAWLVAGRPEGKTVIGMFESWAKTMGGILELAGIGGFLGNLVAFYDEADAAGAAWRGLVAAWWKKFWTQEVGVSDLWSLVLPADGEPIDLPLGEGTERALRTRFGKALAAMRDRQFGDLRIVRGEPYQGAKRWRLIQAGPVDQQGARP